jgi:hypothetical protein
MHFQKQREANSFIYILETPVIHLQKRKVDFIYYQQYLCLHTRTPLFREISLLALSKRREVKTQKSAAKGFFC